MAGDLFSQDAMDCIQWSTEMRDKWGFYTGHKSYRKFSKYVYLFTNPFLYRRFASKYAPVIFPGPQVENEITNFKVDVFINEALGYV